jgi:hypothetical protein
LAELDNLRIILEYLEKSKIINVTEVIQDKVMMNKLIQEIVKMDTDKLIHKMKGKTVGSNVTTNGKNSNTGSRGPSNIRTRQGTPVNIPTTPQATDYTLKSKVNN